MSSTKSGFYCEKYETETKPTIGKSQKLQVNLVMGCFFCGGGQSNLVPCSLVKYLFELPILLTFLITPAFNYW